MIGKPVKTSSGVLYYFGCERCGVSWFGKDQTENHACEYDEPGPIQKAANFTKAVAKHIQASRPLASEDVIQVRFDVCSDCEFLSEKSKCIKCGCPIRIDSRKLKWADSSCPVKKWLRVDI